MAEQDPGASPTEWARVFYSLETDEKGRMSIDLEGQIPSLPGIQFAYRLKLGIDRFLNAVLKTPDAQHAHLDRDVINQPYKLASSIPRFRAGAPSMKDGSVHLPRNTCSQKS